MCSLGTNLGATKLPWRPGYCIQKGAKFVRIAHFQQIDDSSPTHLTRHASHDLGDGGDCFWCRQCFMPINNQTEWNNSTKVALGHSRKYVWKHFVAKNVNGRKPCKRLYTMQQRNQLYTQFGYFVLLSCRPTARSGSNS